MSGWCTCRNGHVSCDSLAPRDGDACGDEPITQCAYEGNPSCTTLPTSEACGCDETGTWRCSCFCYGGMTTCSVDPCNRYPQTINHAYCADHGRVCTYPGNTTCRCEETSPGGEWQFNCN